MCEILPTAETFIPLGLLPFLPDHVRSMFLRRSDTGAGKGFAGQTSLREGKAISQQAARAMIPRGLFAVLALRVHCGLFFLQ